MFYLTNALFTGSLFWHCRCGSSNRPKAGRNFLTGTEQVAVLALIWFWDFAVGVGERREGGRRRM